MKLTKNQEIIYDMIMSDEFAYASFQNFRLNTAINRAITVSGKRGCLTKLHNKEFRNLKKYLTRELQNEK